MWKKKELKNKEGIICHGEGGGGGESTFWKTLEGRDMRRLTDKDSTRLQRIMKGEVAARLWGAIVLQYRTGWKRKGADREYCCTSIVTLFFFHPDAPVHYPFLSLALPPKQPISLAHNLELQTVRFSFKWQRWGGAGEQRGRKTRDMLV